ncbi:uncharacterized protein LOC119076048 [Bradysia coprophila]|uniref:uncharacterized protein LOC119076048 n=1 Tax=Bradysia coprophila TaxID=38358 RepID=UPI00187D9B7B|nr:uncharacterized protein LOC119076048 [Bradysia coprophila]
MKIVTVLIVLCFDAITSLPLLGEEIDAIEQWWNANYFIKFNSPGGKAFYIKTTDGTIYRQKGNITFEMLPFISFASINFKIYDIYFESDDIRGSYPRLVESEFDCENKDSLVRPRLYSFVGPNKKVYKVIVKDGNEHHVEEQSSEALDHFEIKTFGPFEKWEHTFVFSANGVLALDHSISPIPVLANRSILLPELEPNFIETSHNQTVVKFNSPSGRKYYMKDLQNIIAIRHYDEEETAYITFTEPNGRIYDIHIDEKDGHAFIVPKSVDENYVRNERLYSFVAPNGILYRIDHKNGSDNEVPVLVSNSSESSSDLQITLTQPGSVVYIREHFTRLKSLDDGELTELREPPEPDHNKRVKYIFSDNGNRLFDRVNEIDWTPLNEFPALPVDEVTKDFVMHNDPTLTLYTPSGKKYHIFTANQTTWIAVEKGAKGVNRSQSLYITYLQGDRRKTNIHFVPGADPYFEKEDTTNRDDEFWDVEFEFMSFSTPDRKIYSIFLAEGDGIYFIKRGVIPSCSDSLISDWQVKEPDDAPQETPLFIMIRKGVLQLLYRFTWNGDELTEASIASPSQCGFPKTLISLVGK